ncbi:uncharacterized protein LOC125230656 isoform X2 [Leguminivora glycinivorella]|uniref:uncharacterized protein LOC125230656 isoform X2 n=1 Tax=Leguminivora glycinivorella TaxID=1035111 RepID=UPI00200E0675|nr:uncharacterized protein LOC125230656 isoform X2 [Leguminivora glycinivorella]
MHLKAKAAKLTADAEEGPPRGQKAAAEAAAARSMPAQLRRQNIVRAVEQGALRTGNLKHHIARREAGSPPLSNNQTTNASALSYKQNLALQNVSKCINC